MKNTSILSKVVVVLGVVIVGLGLLYFFKSSQATEDIYVGPTKALCGTDESGKAKRCYQVKTDKETTYEAKDIVIKGFAYEPGYEYELKVTKTAEANSTTPMYELKKEISKTEAPYILISEPKDNQIIPLGHQPLKVSGVGRGLYEGNVVLQLADQDGNVLMQDAVVMQSNEPGGAGQWQSELDLEGVEQAGPVLLTAFSPSPADDGKDIKYTVLITLSEAEGQPQALDGTSWKLSSYKVANGTQVKKVPADVVVTAKFADGKVSGKSGCNSYNGTYQADEKSLTFGPQASTRMACEGEAGELEQVYLSHLDQANNYQIQDEQLLVKNADGVTLLIFDKAK